MNSVVPLEDAQVVSNFGGKASNLAKLLTNNIVVPGGIAVGVTAFNDSGTLFTESKAMIQKWLAKQGKVQKYAVRSSALSEDGEEQSWAGQFETFLNVLAEDVAEKVMACHSGVSVRAQAYAGSNTEDFKVAVVVQKMIQPDYAGVLFTRNPVDGSSQIVIEYVKGLAEQLVSGEVTPYSCVWDRESKALEAETNVPFDIAPLIKQALVIEKLYGVPQDIEWTLQKDVYYFVQTRPITTLT